MHSTALQVANSPRSSATYTEYELLKALDEWVFDAYQITQPVHQKIIRYWARRINFKPEISKQIGQGETIGVSDETTAARVKCSTRVVAECRRYTKKTGLLSYQKKYKRVGVWIMFFDCTTHNCGYYFRPFPIKFIKRTIQISRTNNYRFH